jgi:hypothetical protein
MIGILVSICRIISEKNKNKMHRNMRQRARVLTFIGGASTKVEKSMSQPAPSSNRPLTKTPSLGPACDSFRKATLVSHARNSHACVARAQQLANAP